MEDNGSDKKSPRIRSYIWLILGAVCVIAVCVSVTFWGYSQRLNQGDILFAEDVGIDMLLRYETIVSATFNCDYFGGKDRECVDLSVLPPVLETLSDAVFIPVSASEAKGVSNAVKIETTRTPYTIGSQSGLLFIKDAGVTKYYRCSALQNFVAALEEVEEPLYYPDKYASTG